MRTFLALFAVVSLCACGEGIIPPPAQTIPAGPPVPETYTGRWVGHSRTDMEGRDPAELMRTIDAEADGPVLVLRGVCPDGAVDVAGVNDGTRITLGGGFACRSPQGDCPDAKIWYDTGTAEVINDTLRITMLGEYVGCADYRRPASTVFVGRR